MEERTDDHKIFPDEPDQQENLKAEPEEPAILQVSSQEELGGVLQRLRSEPSRSVRLVIPDRAIISQGSIVMKLLADVAGKLNKEVSIVSDLPQVRTLAKQAGLTVEGVEAGDTEGHGFVQGEDVAATAVVSGADSDEDMVIRDFTDQPEDFGADVDDDQDGGKAGAGMAGLWGNGWSGVKQWVASHKVPLILVSVFLLVAIGGLMMAAYYLPHATVTLYTQKRTIDRDIQVTASPNASAVDGTNMVVPATLVNGTASQSKTFEATGEEEVGESATGVVTLINNSTDEKDLPAGTILTADDRQFTLNNSVTVPAKKDGIFDLNPEKGTADASVTAVDIGSDYNLKAGSEFSVGGYDMSTLAGINDEAISGGSSETVKIVTAEDRQNAIESLSPQVQEDARKALEQKISVGQLILEDAADLEVSATNFSHEAGAEADEFSLTVEVVASAPVVSQSDLSSLLTGAIEDRVPDGYELVEGEPEIVTNVLQVEDSGNIQLTSTFKAQVVPVVDTEALVDEIKGEHPSAVESFLQGQPNLDGYDITLAPQLPGPFYRLPRIEGNIEVTVEVRE